MGRYYSGDIEGKFWFGVQSSRAAERFGVESEEPSHLSYSFDDDNLEDVRAQLKKIMDSIGKDNFKKIDNFFNKVSGYNDKIMKDNNLDPDLWAKHSVDYADYILGKKIEKCITEQGYCYFDAEL